MSDNGAAIVLRDYDQDKSVLSMVTTPDAAKERLRMLQEFVRAAMVDGTDYGKIPGAGDKPALLQPGAQKLCELYGLSFSFQDETSTEDWDKPFFFYRRRCVLTRRSDGAFICDGIGTCNSKERRFARQDAYSVVNTIEKMACKRALVMAVLGATRSSGMFTQDVEDNPEQFKRPARRPEPRQAPPPVELETQLEASVDLLSAIEALDPAADDFDTKYAEATAPVRKLPTDNPMRKTAATRAMDKKQARASFLATNGVVE